MPNFSVDCSLDSLKFGSGPSGPVANPDIIEVITSIAILLAGYLQLSSGISVYQWRVVSNLAWFSSLLTLPL